MEGWKCSVEALELAKFYKDKKVFVTGHTGFKGSWLVCLLNKLGAKVCGYSLLSDTTPNMFNLINKKPFIKSVVGDVRDYDSLFSAMNEFQPDIVLHLAAQPIVLKSYEDPRYTYETNVMGTVNVLEAVRHVKSVRSFVNVTTDKVYLNNGNGKAFVETDTLCGYDPYSNSKSCSELVTYSYQQSFFNLDKFDEHKVAISTCRAGNVIGGGDWGEYRLIPDCIRSIESGKPVVIRNPNFTRPFQFVMEALFIYVKLAMLQYENKDYCGSYNIGPDIENCVTVEKIMQTFCKYNENAEYIIQGDKKANHEASLLFLDNTKIKQKLGFKPVFNIDESIKKIVEWFDAYSNNEDMKAVTEKQIDEFFNKVDIVYNK